MQIRRIRVEKFRKLVDPVEIGDLPNGLAVIGGDNEEGKSTLLEAVRAVLFEKHRLGGQGAEAMRPIGQDVAPEIELDFVFGGQDYRLQKRFVRSPEARLEGAGRVWEGDAVEDALENLLGFDRPGRGETSPEHHGLWGLLWVSQGTTFHRVAPTELARDSLSGVLEEEVGEVLGGSIGQELLAHFAAERDRFWGKTGKPVKELKKAQENWESAKQELADNQEALKKYQDRQDRLQRIEDELRHYREEKILEEMEQRFQQAKEKQKQLEQCQSELSEAKSAFELVQAHLQSARTRWEARKALREEMAGIDKDLAELEDARQARQTEAQTAEDEREERRKRVQSVEQQAREAQEAEQRLAGVLQYLDRSEKRQSLSDQYKKAREAHKKAKEARTSAQAIRVSDKELKALRELERAVDQAEGRLAGSATELSVDVNVAYEVTGEAQTREGDYLVTGSSEVSLAGVGKVGVRAGGAELAEIQETLRRTRQERDDKLAELGAKSLQQAEELHSRKQALEREAKNQEQVLHVHAPDGLQALQDRIEVLDAELANLPEPEGEEAQKGRPELQQAHGEAQDRRKEVEEGVKKAREAFDEQQEVVRQAQNALTKVQTNLKGRKDRRESVRQQLETGRAEISDEALSQKLTDEQAKVETAEKRVKEAREALEALHPEDIQLELGNAEKAVSRAQEEMEKLEKERNDLKGELRGAGSQGLAENQEELERKVQEAERAYRSMEREAKAVWMAAEALEEAASEARQAYLQPLVRHLNPYLGRVFTDAEPVLGDTLALEGLRRGDHVEDFRQLSVGAREQVAVLTRLAFADLLTEEGGEAPPVILDDALVYADEHRFETMKHLLARSAQKHQVLILTCRPMEYLSLGAEPFRLN